MEHLGILGMGIEFALTIWSLSSNLKGKKEKPAINEQEKK